MTPDPRPPLPPSNRQSLEGRRVLIALAILGVLLVVAGIFLFKYWKKREGAQPSQGPAPSGDELRVHVLNVGQGDSIFIIAPGGKTVLVDAGPPGGGRAVMDVMKRSGADHIDLLVATHAHADHIGGADEVMRRTKVSTVLDSRVPGTSKNYEDFLKQIEKVGAKYIPASPGQSFDLGGGASLKVLAPIEPFFTKTQLRSGANEPNANSVVMRLEYGDFTMLLTGDAEAETEERLMRAGADIRAKVLKVGHHGSRYASSEKFLRAGGFETAVISDGADNRYGHPSQEALDRFKPLGINLHRTDLEGEITIVSRGRGYEVRAERPPAGDLWAGRPAVSNEPGGVDNGTGRRRGAGR